MEQEDEGVVATALEIVEIAEVGPCRSSTGDHAPFSETEWAYAQSKSDPERRLAARLAAKRAVCRLLGSGVALGDVEVVRGPGGPPFLRLSEKAEQRLRACGASRVLASLSHGRTHAVAAVLLLR